MGCTTTTSMYLNISTEICANASTSRSGNTVTVSGTFSVNQPGGYNLNAIYAYVDGQTTWQRVKTANSRSGSANFSFSFQSSSAGSATYTAVFQVWNNAESGPVGGTASTTFSVSWPAGGTAPSDGHIDGLSSAYNLDNGLIEFYANNVSVSTSTTLTTSQFRILLTPNTGGGLAYQHVAFTNGSSVVLNQSNSIAGGGGVTIVPNQLYYSGIYAANSAGDYYYNGPSIVAPAAPASFSIEPIDSHSVSISYVTVADGGYYSKTLEYSLDGGMSWVAGTTVFSGVASSGTFTISSLDSYKDYTIRFRVTTSAGSTDSGSISFILLKPEFYGSVANLTEKTNKLYGSLSNQSKSIVKFYASENGRAKLIYKEK